MSILFPLNKNVGGFCKSCTLRIVKKLDIGPTDIYPGEVVISKDFIANESLIGSVFEAGKTRYDDKLYMELLKLKISTGDENISEKDKKTIMDFVCKFGSPYGIFEASANMRSDPNISFFESGDNINWVFIKINSKPQDQNSVSYFYHFRNMLRDFIDSYNMIKDGNISGLTTYSTVINNALADSHLYLPSRYEGAFKTTWISITCISQCYLELYDLIMSNQQIKVCKYCGVDFESSKSNEVRCHEHRNPNLYRKLYYQKNIEEEQKKARYRMALRRKNKI